MTQICPLCSSPSPVFYQNKNQTYYQCGNCDGIFIDKSLRPDPKEEKLRYETHNNDVFDKGYQNFVSPITAAIAENFTKDHLGLDFGAGTGPVITKVLKDRSFRIKAYDPFFHKNLKLLDKKYDYIACCEVMEHFYRPKKEFSLLKKLLLKGGILYCMTDIYDKSINFSSWYYKNDPTHVFIYQKNTIDWIKNEFGFSDVQIKDRLITFFN
jgi:SAM-dependent methyltransferase